MLTPKDRGLLAQIAGAIAANYQKSGRSISNLVLADDSVDLAIKILEQVDKTMKELEPTEPVKPVATSLLKDSK